MPIFLRWGDIRTLSVDAIICSQGQGEALPCTAGDAVIPPLIVQPAQDIIHVVETVRQDRSRREGEAMETDCSQGLQLAVEEQCHSVAISFCPREDSNCPVQQQLQVLRTVVEGFLEHHDLRIYLVASSPDAFALPAEEVNLAAAWMKKHVSESARENKRFCSIYRAMKRMVYGRMGDEGSSLTDPVLQQAKEVIETSFCQLLCRGMERKGISRVQLGRKANLSGARLRALLEGETPTKPEALAISLALELDISIMRKLLAAANLFLDVQNLQELLVEYCIRHQKYDIFSVNQLLLAMDLPQLSGE